MFITVPAKDPMGVKEIVAIPIHTVEKITFSPGSGENKKEPRVSITVKCQPGVYELLGSDATSFWQKVEGAIQFSANSK